MVFLWFAHGFIHTLTVSITQNLTARHPSILTGMSLELKEMMTKEDS